MIISMKERKILKLKKERALIETRLKYAMNLFYACPVRDAVYAVCTELVYAYVYNMNAAIPVGIDPSGVKYSMFHLGGGRYAYIACTDTDDLIRCPETSSAWVSWRSLLKRAAADEETEGIILNPYHDSDASLVLNHENIAAIIHNANVTMDALPDDIRDDVRQGI